MIRFRILTFFTFVFFINGTPVTLSANTEKLSRFSAAEISTGLPVLVEAKNQKKGLVVVFLSARCPCSNSHVTELSKLSKEYPDYLFIGLHSNQDESLEESKSYFNGAHLPFKVLQDEKAELADRFGAFKTPHSYVISPSGDLLYKGGISSSNNFENSKNKFLREALEDISAGKKIRTPEGRTLGCAIARGD